MSELNVLHQVARSKGIPLPRISNYLVLPEKNYKGPICDIIGYSQHFSECQSDSLFEIIMFTDGMKEISQPMLYSMTDAELIEKSQKAGGVGNKDAIRMFDYMRLRFVNLYNRIIHRISSKPNANAYGSRKEEHLVRKNDQSYQLARYCSLESGLEIKRLIKGEGQENVKYGIDTSRLFIAAKVFLNFFDLDTKISVQSDNLDDYLPNIIAFKISVKTGDSLIQNHANGLFLCGGKWLYYDNEAGLTEFDKEEFITYSKNKQLRSIFHDGVLTMARGREDGTISHVWIKGDGGIWGWSNKDGDLAKCCRKVKFSVGDLWFPLGIVSRDFSVDFFFVPNPDNALVTQKNGGGKKRTIKIKRKRILKRKTRRFL